MPEAQSLSQERCALGCAAVGDLKNKAVWAGGWAYYNDSQHASDVVDILDTVTHTWKSTQMNHRTIAPSVASIASLVLITGGTNYGWLPTSGSIADAFLYGGYTNLGVDRYDIDADRWTYVPLQLSPLLYDGTSAPMRIAVPIAGQFIAIVAGEVVFQHDGMLDPTMTNVTSFRRLVDLYDAAENKVTFCSIWYVYFFLK